MTTNEYKLSYTAQEIDKKLGKVDKLSEEIDDLSVFVTPQMFGAVANGETDDSAAIQAAIDNTPDGGIVLFPNGTYRVSNRLFISNRHNITILNGYFISLNSDGAELGGTFQVNEGSSGIVFENCHFYKGVQVVFLWDCNHIKITGNTFEECGYAILQQDGYTSNNVIVTNNTCKNARLDFVECNCEINAPSKNWIISNNIYTKDEVPTTFVAENRFVGLTAIENVTITGNVIENCLGEAISCEDLGGEIVIDGNTLKNCYGNYIDIDNGLKTCIISNNYITNELIVDNEQHYFINLSSGENPDEYNVTILGNTFIGNGEESHPIFICHPTTVWNKLICDNTFIGFDTIFSDAMYDNARITNVNFFNNIVKANTFLRFDTQAGQNSFVASSTFTNNKIYGDILLDFNNTGTTFSNRLSFDGNYIDGNVSIKNCKDVLFINNMLEREKTFTFDNTSYYAERMYASNNYIADVGKLDDVGITATSAQKLTTARLINGIAFDGTEDIEVFSPSELPPLSKILSAKGWYRIAKISTTAISVQLALGSCWSYSDPCSGAFVINYDAFHGGVITKLGATVPTSFTKIRTVSQGQECYIEVYYNVDVPNTCFFKFNNITNYDGSITVIEGTAGEIPDGYTAVETEWT